MNLRNDSGESATSFPYERLPIEIRLRILSDTDLVRKDVHEQWDPLQHEALLGRKKDFKGAPRLREGTRHRHWAMWISWGNQIMPRWLMIPPRPMGMLTASRQTRIEALSVLYERNEFSIGRDFSTFKHPFCEYIRRRLESISEYKLFHTRRLVLRLCHTPNREDEFAEMNAIFRRLSEHGNRSQLWLKILLLNWHRDYRGPGYRYSTKSDPAVMKRFRFLIRDLRGRYGLKRVSLLCRGTNKSDFETLMGPPACVPSDNDTYGQAYGIPI